MDDSPSLERRPGGAVEPANRAAIAQDVLRKHQTISGERYEMRDAYAEVTYRLKTMDEMIAKADHLGITRFTAVAEDGRRTPIFRAGGTWSRPDAPEPRAASPGPANPTRDVDIALPIPARAPVPEPAASKAEPNAERTARVASLEAALNDRYLVKRAPIRIGDVTIGQTEYRYRGDAARVAFTESAFRLSTDTNSPSVARSMVDVAEARNWQSLRVSGNEDFKRMVWLEASLRNVRTVGYEPVPGDQEMLRKEQRARQGNRIEPQAAATPRNGPAVEKQSGRGSGTRKTVLAALEAVLIAQRVPERQRQAVMIAAEQNLAERLRRGEVHKVKVYDIAAPSQRPAIAPSKEIQRNRERPAPSR